MLINSIPLVRIRDGDVDVSGSVSIDGDVSINGSVSIDR